MQSRLPNARGCPPHGDRRRLGCASWRQPGAALDLLALCLPLDPLLCAAGTALGLGSAVGTVPLLFAASDVAFWSVAMLAARGLPPPPGAPSSGRAGKAA